MGKTILEEILEKIADGFIEVGNDMKMLLKIPTPTAEGQVLTAKLVDGELQPVWVEANTSINTGMFDNLLNCSYQDDALNYTNGALAWIGGAAYFASSSNPVDFEVAAMDASFVSIGDSNDPMAYFENSKGLLFDSHTVILDGQEFAHFEDLQMGDTVQFVIKDSKATVTILRTGESYTSQESDYLANPKYLNILVIGTSPLPIKAI